MSSGSTIAMCRSTSGAPSPVPARANLCRPGKSGRACRLRLAAALLVTLPCARASAAELSIEPSSIGRIGAVDDRFQSYNIEMVEVTGGRFWKPYDSPVRERHSELLEYRPPIDLHDPRLRKLAAALAPAYLRVSGTWANATYFADLDLPPSPPAGFDGVLSLEQWRAAIDFSKTVGADIVTSFAVGPGNRDATGAWSPDQARRLLAYTYSAGGRIAAAEFMNEPDVAVNGASAAGDDAESYARDFTIFHAFMKKNYPQVLILGPGTSDEAASAARLLAASEPASVDAISYHYYGALSERCIGRSAPEDALSEERLAGTDRGFAFYQSLRDRFAPGKPIWLTETAEAACGGNRWDATFLDTFRYLDQLGRLAAAGVQVVMHNTLAGSDYGLLDERTFEPRPNFWGAWLWRRLMGRIVLDPAVRAEPGLHLYAHCQRGTPGGVSLLIINVGREWHAVTLPVASERYALRATNLQDNRVQLNDTTLRLDADNNLPKIAGGRTMAGALSIAPASITFVTIPDAANKACR
jgi:Glycosyl hydrolase family 79, N-terminal domain